MSDIVLLIDWLCSIDLFSCIAASLFNKLTYLLTYLLTNGSAYRPLSAFKAWEITVVLTYDVPFAVCLFPVANDALLVPKIRV